MFVVFGVSRYEVVNQYGGLAYENQTKQTLNEYNLIKQP